MARAKRVLIAHSIRADSQELATTTAIRCCLNFYMNEDRIKLSLQKDYIKENTSCVREVKKNE